MDRCQVNCSYPNSILLLDISVPIKDSITSLKVIINAAKIAAADRIEVFNSPTQTTAINKNKTNVRIFLYFTTIL